MSNSGNAVEKQIQLFAPSTAPLSSATMATAKRVITSRAAEPATSILVFPKFREVDVPLTLCSCAI